MKHSIPFLSALLCGALALTACDPTEDPIDVDPTDDDSTVVVTDAKLTLSIEELNFGREAATKSFDVITDGAWTSELPPYADWFTYTPTTGKGKTTVTVTVQAIGDSAYVDYSSYITFKTASDSKYITITQK